MKKTPLYKQHVQLGANLVDFNGWQLPVQYSSIMKEHAAVRNQAGLFDVSHMGEIWATGPDAQEFINKVITNDVGPLQEGKALYTVLCRHDGGILDDFIVYKYTPQRFLICVNASNREKDFRWLVEQLDKERVKLEDHSDNYCQIALQGPKSLEILKKICDPDLPYYHFTEKEISYNGVTVPTMISRTGYTGEWGYELYMPSAYGPHLWQALLEAGSPLGLIPCGLGARDILRTEVNFPLYGHELTENVTPFAAGLAWVVKMDKPSFIGKDALLELTEKKTCLRNIVMEGRAIPRSGCEVYGPEKKEPIGYITSGTLSPMLQKPIAIAQVSKDLTIGEDIFIKIRNRFFAGQVVKAPFYKKEEK